MSRYLIFVMLIILSACKGHDDKGNEHKENADSSLVLRSTYRNLKINDKLSNILKEFITEANCKECIYEMYVDKVRPDEAIVVLKSRVYSTEYMKQINPLFTSKIDGVQFDIFSGLEDIFIGDKAELTTNPGMDTTKAVYKVWSLFIKADSIKIEKDIGNPFFPAEPPKIEIKK
jgi:hypothetical protein